MIGYVFYTHRHKLFPRMDSKFRTYILLFFLDPFSLPLWPYSHLQASPVTLFLAVSSLTVKCITGLSPDFLYKSLGLYVGLYQVLGSPVTNTQL